MAPEQIEGRPVDGRTDQYALACAAYELLAGQPPFERELDQAVIYAQPFPHKAAAAQVGAVILHPAGKTATYSFPVTPDVATRYQVRLFDSSTATSPAATSPVSMVYVTTERRTVSEDSPKACDSVCHIKIVFTTTCPPPP